MLTKAQPHWESIAWSVPFVKSMPKSASLLPLCRPAYSTLLLCSAAS